MFMDSPDILLMTAVGAFLTGWTVAKISAYIGNKYSARARDPRDDRIRSLEAELRIANGETEKSKNTVGEREQALEEARAETASVERHLQKSEELIAELRNDLKDSVVKTRELREELANRAAESLKSEVKLREVETELSVAQASTDMLATGVLDYSLTDGDDEDSHKPQIHRASG